MIPVLSTNTGTPAKALLQLQKFYLISSGSDNWSRNESFCSSLPLRIWRVLHRSHSGEQPQERVVCWVLGGKLWLQTAQCLKERGQQPQMHRYVGFDMSQTEECGRVGIWWKMYCHDKLQGCRVELDPSCWNFGQKIQKVLFSSRFWTDRNHKNCIWQIPSF